MLSTALAFVCPICNAQPNQVCMLATGAPRNQSHLERKWMATDYRIGHAPEKAPRVTTRLKAQKTHE